MQKSVAHFQVVHNERVDVCLLFKHLGHWLAASALQVLDVQVVAHVGAVLGEECRGLIFIDGDAVSGERSSSSQR